MRSGFHIRKISLFLVILVLFALPKFSDAESPKYSRSNFAGEANFSDIFISRMQENGDRWIAQDKFYHFTVSAGLALGSFYVYRDVYNNNREGSYYFSGGFTVSIGALKEYYDSKHPSKHTASWKDFVVDVAGTGFGLALAFIVVD